eukprot:GEMP01043979.1.p1 GENE.GEMP01043979.1~~GEMP01043979.1.p1  ORF type:complete len:214 (+),score=42.50 GEMP01043979.1:26-643(+)
MRGKFIVLEGLDRSGKSTQSRLLMEALQKSGVKVKRVCFPDRTTMLGQVINDYLQNKAELSDESIHLLFSANRWEVAASLEKDLREGITIVSDRYAFSGVAFTAAKGLDFNWCKNSDVGLPEPDAVFYLEASPDKTKARADFGDERYEKLEFQQKVKAQYERFEGDFWHVIDACRDINTIHEELLEKVGTIEVGDDIRKLWAGAP